MATGREVLVDDAPTLDGMLADIHPDADAADARAAARDPAAFEAIYLQHRLTVYRYARSRTASDGILDSGPEPQTVVYEMEEGRDDLSGTGTITIDEFRTDVPDPDSDITTETKIIEGPWVLTFEGPPKG